MEKWLLFSAQSDQFLCITHKSTAPAVWYIKWYTHCLWKTLISLFSRLLADGLHRSDPSVGYKMNKGSVIWSLHCDRDTLWGAASSVMVFFRGQRRSRACEPPMLRRALLYKWGWITSDIWLLRRGPHAQTCVGWRDGGGDSGAMPATDPSWIAESFIEQNIK